MSATTDIQWCDSTFNAWIGCTKVSVGPQGACENCYAEVATPSRSMAIKWGTGQPRHRTSASTWHQPLIWERKHEQFFAEHGRRRRVFCSSLADVFDNEVSTEWRADLFQLIHDTPHLDWLLLTKRIGNATNMMWHAMRDAGITALGMTPDCMPNVWLGATVATQEEADRDIPKLLATPARIRFLSIEPMLGPIDLTRIPIPRGLAECSGGTLPRVDWVIVGGESGHNARSMVIGWAKDIVRQCAAAGVACFVKQLGSRPVNREGVPHPQIHAKGGDPREWPEVLRVREFPEVA